MGLQESISPDPPPKMSPWFRSRWPEPWDEQITFTVLPSIRMRNSRISWTNHTYNPWLGCTRISEECLHCYAERDNVRRFHRVEWGPSGNRRRTSPATLRAPLTWNRQSVAEGVRQRVFCASYADVFDGHPSIQQCWREDLWQTIRDTPALDWLLLTKRPENFERFLPETWGSGYPNVCLMVSAATQRAADRRIPVLLETPAAKRGISAEPFLEAVDFSGYLAGLDWVIVGAESGTGARPMEPQWARNVRDACDAANTPFFFKQWGCWSPQPRSGTQQHVCANGEVLYFRNDAINHGGNILDGRVHEEHPFETSISSISTANLAEPRGATAAIQVLL